MPKKNFLANDNLEYPNYKRLKRRNFNQSPPCDMAYIRVKRLIMIAAIAFYVFSAILLFSAVMVITARNPVHSVLFLILGFFNSAGLFLMLGAEFVAMIMVIVYVGAVAVLFLFVVMMLDVDFANLRKGAMQYVPLGILIGIILMAEMVFAFSALDSLVVNKLSVGTMVEAKTNTHALGQILYTDYVAPFQVAGMVLFVAMIGAIVRTHRVRPGVRRQNIGKQHAVKPADVIDVVKVVPGSGA